mmetsp:Transcript_40051/g.96038  ORF Transcript_40051/g.96038 Transcript_40051/m.96038 type:complete len:366 (+) Transcript_40051:573-1670(+)
MGLRRHPLAHPHPGNRGQAPLQERRVVLLLRLAVGLLSQADVQLPSRDERHDSVLVPGEKLAVQTQEIEGLQQALDLAAAPELVGLGRHVASHLLQGIYDGGPQGKKRVILVRVVDECVVSGHSSSVLLRDRHKLFAIGNRQLLVPRSFHGEATKHQAVEGVVRGVLGLLRGQLGRRPVRAPDRSLLLHEDFQVRCHCLHGPRHATNLLREGGNVNKGGSCVLWHIPSKRSPQLGPIRKIKIKHHLADLGIIEEVHHPGRQSRSFCCPEQHGGVERSQLDQGHGVVSAASVRLPLQVQPHLHRPSIRDELLVSGLCKNRRSLFLIVVDVQLDYSAPETMNLLGGRKRDTDSPTLYSRRWSQNLAI